MPHLPKRFSSQIAVELFIRRREQPGPGLCPTDKTRVVFAFEHCLPCETCMPTKFLIQMLLHSLLLSQPFTSFQLHNADNNIQRQPSAALLVFAVTVVPPSFVRWSSRTARCTVPASYNLLTTVRRNGMLRELFPNLIPQR